MDVSSPSSSTASTQQQVTVLKKELDNESQIASTLLESVEATSPANPPGIGQHLDVKA